MNGSADEAVDLALDKLPHALSEVVLTVRALVGSPEQGGWAFSRDPRFPPVLEYHQLVLEDLFRPDSAAAAARSLWVSGWFRLAAAVTHRLAVEEPHTIQPEYGLAAGLFQNLADEHLAKVIPMDSDLRPALRRVIYEGVEALAVRRSRARWLPAGKTLAQLRPGARWAPMRTLSIGALHVAGRGDLTNQLLDVLARVDDSFQTRAEIMDVHRDVERGVESGPVAAARSDGVVWAPHECNTALGTLIIRGRAHKLVDEARRSLEQAGKSARGMGLETLTARIEEIAGDFSRLSADLAHVAKVDIGSPVRSRATAVNPLSETSMALSFLTSDTSLRESWDVYRNGFLGTPERIGRIFPMGFVLDNMLATGADVDLQIRQVLDICKNNNGDYFDGPVRLPREIDTLGLMLRLRSRLQLKDPVLDTLLVEPVFLAASIVRNTGTLPVWLAKTTPPGGREELLGMACATCRANFLLGATLHRQAALAPPEFDELLDSGTAELIHDLERRGTGASVYYPPLHLLWTCNELIDALKVRDDKRLRQRAGQLNDVARPLLLREVEYPMVSPQRAALLLLSDPGTPADSDTVPPRRDAWLRCLIRSQRPDGGWDAEPLYSIPVPRHPGAWYSSRTATTSLCHRALVLAEDKQ
ncbi:hypothetical protein [Streptomyces wuyuanensis]|uniref:hypothetical protein n=1 Tax=Streptomyces wuyuanensis TaxID=1196353 RepID=UPI0034488254